MRESSCGASTPRRSAVLRVLQPTHSLTRHLELHRERVVLGDRVLGEAADLCVFVFGVWAL